MLPRVSPEPSYGPNGQVRYTGIWGTRNLGRPPVGPFQQGQEQFDHHPPSNFASFFLPLAVLELCLSLAFAGVGAYYWITADDEGSKANDKLTAAAGIQVLVVGIPCILHSLVATIALRPGAAAVRVTGKRLVIAFSFPIIQLLIAHIRSSWFKVVDQHTLDALTLTEACLVSAILIILLVILYPVCKACNITKHEGSGGDGGCRVGGAVSLTANAVVALILLSYLCFSIYGLHAAIAVETKEHTAIERLDKKVDVSIFGICATSIMLLVSLGALHAIVKGDKANLMPYLVAGLATVPIQLKEIGGCVDLATTNVSGGNSNNDFDPVYLGVLILNCVSAAAITSMISVILACYVS